MRRNCMHLIPLFLAAFAVPAAAQGPETVLSIDDPRPLAAAVLEMERRTLRAITYEDPAYIHESEVRDVTDEVRRDKSGPRILIPSGGKIDLPLPAGSAEANGREALLQRWLEAHESSDLPGRFRLERNGEILHVVPAQAKGLDGAAVEQRPILDLEVTLPAGRRTAVETLEALVQALDSQVEEKVILGLVPVNLLSQAPGLESVEGEKARVALVRLLSTVERKLSWQLFYDPGLRWWVLNLHPVE